MSTAGRSCPLHYRYGAEVIAQAPSQTVETLYVIGGLYGNLPALDAIEILLAQEAHTATLCFNGDFNWFNVDAYSFGETNRRVLYHQSTLGNVEAELIASTDEAGCGCAYPESVATDRVERSNHIHARLKSRAAGHPEILAKLAVLPKVARYRVGDITVGVVHGDAESLAGWHFDDSMPQQLIPGDWMSQIFEQAEVDVFASSHTCTPVMRYFAAPHEKVVINNGAAGMPNFIGTRFGVLTRISIHPSPHAVLYGVNLRDVFVDALPIHYDDEKWQQQFLANWPEGSAAWLSYFSRITNGPDNILLR